MNDPRRILIVSEAHLIKTFVADTITNIMKETGVVFDCLIITPPSEELRNEMRKLFGNVYINEYPRGIIGKIPKLRMLQAIAGLRILAGTLPDYDIIHIHFNHYILAFVSPILRRKTRKLFVTFYGGDFDELSNTKHWFNKKTVDLLDGVFAINKITLQKVISKYQVNINVIDAGVMKLLMHNMSSIGPFLKNHSIDMAKDMWKIDKRIIVCAYSAGVVMQHEKIIDELNRINKNLCEYKIIFPMTYGSRGDETRAMVESKLEKSSLDSIILKDFLSVEMLHALRLATDIFIVIPSRDQMASSLLEHLAAGSVVITGKWLPYDSLAEMGVYYLTIDKPEDLASTLLEVIQNLEEHKRRSLVNRKLILKMMSWESIGPSWYKYYKLRREHEWI